MTSRCRLLLFVWIVILPVSALADTPGTLTPTIDARRIAVVWEPEVEDSCNPVQSVSDTPSPAFSFFDAEASGCAFCRANQTSTVTTGQLSGSGEANGFVDLCYGDGTSTYDVTFTLSLPATLDLSGTIGGTSHGGVLNASTTARLSREGQTLYEETTDPALGAVSLSYTETVQPGTYRLFVEAYSDRGSSTFSFTLDADPALSVPALGPVALLALAALLLGGRGLAVRRGKARH